MRVPLEILRLILEHRVDQYVSQAERASILTLRLVSKTFDEEILYHAFSERPRSVWPTAPHTLRLKYLCFRACHAKKELGPFSHLCAPVFERELLRLGVVGADCDTKIREWCALSQHHVFSICGIVTSRWSPLRSYYEHYVWYEKNVPELRYHCTEMKAIDDTVKLWMLKRIENDHKYLQILTAILRDDQEAVLDSLPGTYIGVDDVNLCFGTTLLAITVDRGSIEILRLLLRSVRTVQRKHLYIYLRLALARSHIFVTVLLDKLSGSAKATRAFTMDLLVKSITTNNVALFDAVLAWMSNVQDIPDKLHIIEFCFTHAVGIDRRHRVRNTPPPSTDRLRTQTFLAYPAPACPDKTLNSPQLVSSYHIDDTAHDDRLNRVYNDTLGYYLQTQSFEPESDRPLFQAAAMGLLHWADWMLWAGADPRHLEDEIGILGHAWKVGLRREVADMLDAWGWDVGKLEVEIW